MNETQHKSSPLKNTFRLILFGLIGVVPGIFLYALLAAFQHLCPMSAFQLFGLTMFCYAVLMLGLLAGFALGLLNQNKNHKA